MAKTTKAKTTKAPEFDEETVLAEMAAALDVDADELEIEEDDGYGSFIRETVYRVELGDKEYCVVESDDVAHELAVEIVKQDLEEEPGNFNKDFIESHIDMDRLRRDLRDDVYSEKFDYFDDIASSDPERFWRDSGLEKPEPDEDDDEDEDPEPSDEDVEKAAEDATDEALRHPMAYLEEIYSHDEAVEKAIEIAGIDVPAAAEEAVQTDGEGHFLSHYDGDTHETKSRFVYWRDR